MPKLNNVPAKIKFEVSFSVSRTAMRTMIVKDQQIFIRARLQQQIAQAIADSIIIERKDFEYESLFSSMFYYASPEEFYRVVRNEANALMKHLTNQGELPRDL